MRFFINSLLLGLTFFWCLAATHSAMADPLFQNLSAVRVPAEQSRNLQKIISKQLCDQYRVEFRDIIFPRQDVDRYSVRSFLNYYFVDCFDEPYALNSSACSDSRRELVEPLASYGWNYFSGRCELVPSTAGNSNGDQLFCAGYIDKLLSGEVSEPKVNMEVLAAKPNLVGLVASHLFGDSKNPSPAMAGLIEILKDYRRDCYCGNGRLDFSEECDPALDGKTCDAGCRALVVRDVELIKRISPKIQNIEGVKSLFPLMLDN